VYTNSAGACNSFFRSIASATLVIASHRIVLTLGSKWGVSLFGFLTLGLVPIPMIFLRYGQSMRAKSHFAREANAIVANMHTDEPVDLRQAEIDEKAASLTTSNEA